jgi:hypothetical protein
MLLYKICKVYFAPARRAGAMRGVFKLISRAIVNIVKALAGTRTVPMGGAKWKFI